MCSTCRATSGAEVAGLTPACPISAAGALAKEEPASCPNGPVHIPVDSCVLPLHLSPAETGPVHWAGITVLFCAVQTRKPCSPIYVLPDQVLPR